MNITVKYDVKGNDEFRDKLMKELPAHLFYLVLYRLKGSKKKLQATEVDYFPIQWNTCMLLGNPNAIGIGFDKRQFLLTCIGKDRVQSLNNHKEKVKKTLDKIEAVLGKVPAVEELRNNVKEYQKAISDFFDYDIEEIPDETI